MPDPPGLETQRKSGLIPAIVGGLFVALFLIWVQTGVRFGTHEEIREIQDIDLQGPQGEDLYLAFKTSGYYVYTGVYAKTDGYVLGIRGEERRYFPLAAEQIAELQADGALPTPMPHYSLSLVDYAVGYSLWIIITALVAIDLYERRLKRKREAQAHVPTGAERS